MNPSQNDSFGNFSNGQGGGAFDGQTSFTYDNKASVNIGNETKTKNRLLFSIIAISVMVLIIVGVIMIIASSRNDMEKKIFFDSWEKYYRMIVLGPDDNEAEIRDVIDVDNISQWYLTKTYEDYDESVQDYVEYYLLLEKALSDFSSISDIVGIESFDKYYYGIAKTFFAYGTRETKSKDLLRKYISEGKMEALAYIDSVIVSNSPVVDIINENLKGYFLNELEMYELYSRNGCIDEGRIDYVCDMNFDDYEKTIDYINMATKYMDTVENFAENQVRLFNLFAIRTRYINERVRDAV